MTESKPDSFEHRFERALAKLGNTTDALGLGLDAGIREPVAALLALGHGTSQSCEGHPAERTPSGEWKTWATGGPYIDVFHIDLAASSDERLRIAKATGQWPRTTPENRRKAVEHMIQINGLINEFYGDRKVDPFIKLTTSLYGGDTTRIESNGVPLQEYNRDNPVEWDATLKKFQEEMQCFGAFLLKKGLELDVKNKNKLQARNPG